MRLGMLEVLGQGYVTIAPAKGLKETAVVRGGPAKRPPVGNHHCDSAPAYSLGGTVIIKTMFQWPGMGRMGIQAISRRDYPVLMGQTFIAAVLFLFSNW